MRDISLAERVMLLAVWASDGDARGEAIDHTLAGAELAELVLAGRVTIRNGTIRPTGGAGDASTALDAPDADFTTAAPVNAANWIGDNAARVREACSNGLTRRGLLHEHRRRRWGFWPVRYRTVEPGAQQPALDELREFGAGTDVEPRVVTLAALLRTSELLDHVLPEAEAGEIARRLDENGTGSWLDEAVGEAIEQVRTAVTAAITAGTVVVVTNT
ncbi:MULTISPECIES: GPP34 family phosphoprotein [unclassified Actinopolyspora]|uniref:GOLPH3/VPS74 family protein n=1 Tax=unclassified Actinopolyspora TaxID=2639451 RepID=UPI0013F62749|nr:MULTISPECIES: GPP34 family phosphoprotein [unclassified Actinopolyspora]NHD18355.1 GPP34 family phosphoprotein [Actinopolyspora sp. BKK2]NHE76966.1 GPP34 family phosphoprotein [Actinopolyspora sp. BKK1]